METYRNEHGERCIYFTDLMALARKIRREHNGDLVIKPLRNELRKAEIGITMDPPKQQSKEEIDEAIKEMGSMDPVTYAENVISPIMKEEGEKVAKAEVSCQPHEHI